MFNCRCKLINIKTTQDCINELNKKLNTGVLTIEDYYGSGQNSHILYKRIIINGRHEHLANIVLGLPITIAQLVEWRDAVVKEYGLCKRKERADELRAIERKTKAISAYKKALEKYESANSQLQHKTDALHKLGIDEGLV